ncbi:hypothetical protein ThrDRAFT_02818 [Frankia casuarinae]|nr:hypothetical protein ThrDRAFT_02818 [Frankia casuarinae]
MVRQLTVQRVENLLKETTVEPEDNFLDLEGLSHHEHTAPPLGTLPPRSVSAHGW